MKRWIWIVLLAPAFGQNNNSSPTGHEWNTYSQSLRVGYALGFIDGARLGAIREMNLCLDLVNISLGLVNTSANFFKQWNNKYPEIVSAASSQMLNQADRPEFKQDFCLRSFNSGFENITVGQFVTGVDAFYHDYRNEGIPVNYAIQHVRDEINGKSAAELDTDLLWERRCVADPKTCTDSKPGSLKP